MPTDQQGRRQLLHLHHGRLTNCKLTDSEMENAMSRNTSDKNKNRIFRNVIIVMLVAGLLATLALSGIMAKYTTERKKSVEMKSKNFHFTSNYLEEDGANYTVVDWGQGFDIDLFNYEKENLALMTNDDITYTISISDDWIYTVDGKTSTSYTMEESSTRTSDTIHVKPTNAITQGSVTVTVTTTSPFEKTLSATFTVSGKKSPEYTMEDQNDGTALLTIKTNDYSGSVTINWTEDEFTPDNTDGNMTEWIDSNETGSITVKKNTTYELLFFIDGSSKSCSDVIGTGTSITLTK